MLRVTDLAVNYGDQPAVKDVSFQVEAGRALAITGPPGTGKTSLLQALAGDVEHTGTVDVDGEVGWLVPCAGITVDQLLSLGGGDYVDLRNPGDRTPSVVLADEGIDGCPDARAIARFEDAVFDVCARGAAVVLTTHQDELVRFCDDRLALAEGGVQSRSAVLAEYIVRTGDRDFERPPTDDDVARAVRGGAMPAVDANTFAAFVVLPALRWGLSTLSQLSSWRIVDTTTMRRLRRRMDAAAERDAGPEGPDGHRLLWPGRVVGSHDQLQLVAGTAATNSFAASRYDTWRPGGSGDEAGGPLGELEHAWCPSTGYIRPHPLALTDEECDQLVAIARTHGERGELPRSAAGPSRPFEATVTEHVSLPLRAKLMLAVTSANRCWWDLEIGWDWRFEMKKYGPNQGHPAHQDLAATATTRKMAASVQLSAPDDYEGGDLVLTHPGLTPARRPAPIDRGSIVVYPAWTVHEVEPVTAGERWSLVVWTYGPPPR